MQLEIVFYCVTKCGSTNIMKTYKLYSTQDKTILYSGVFENIHVCLERAVAENVDLSHIDLRGFNLSTLNLDNAQMPFADFSNCNLSGTNLSEAKLNSARLTHAALYNTCFAYSEMQACDFSGAHFGGTDMTGCNISFASFTTLSCFNLDFTHMRTMKDCVFINSHGQRTTMSRPPVVVKGMSKKPIIMMKDRVFHGHASYDYDQLFSRINRMMSKDDRAQTIHKISD